MELRTTKRARTQNRQFISQKRDNFLKKVLEMVNQNEPGAQIITPSGDDLTQKDRFTEEWLSVVVDFGGKDGKNAHIAFTTDGLTHEVGLRRNIEKYERITNLCKGLQNLPGYLNILDENYWWYLHSSFKDQSEDNVCNRFKDLSALLQERT